MNIAHLNLVALVQGGFRYPIVAVNVPKGATREECVVLELVREQQHPHQVVTDARPWLLFAGTDEQGTRWALTNHMGQEGERWRQVRTVADLDGLEASAWQATCIGTWWRNVTVREAAKLFIRRGGFK